MRDDAAAAVLAIYQAGMDTGDASFDSMASSWDQFSASRRPDHRFVAVDGGEVLGWIAVSPTSSRPRYGFRVVGRRERFGQHYGRWRDVILLERRSLLA